MNILILNWRDPKNPLSGGAEYVTLKHAKAWLSKGDAVTWFTSSFPGAKNEENVDGVSIVRHGSIFTVFIYAWLYYLANRNNIDLIVDQVHGIPFFSKLYTRKPIVVFVHEVAGIIWDVVYPFPVSWIGKMCERLYIWIYRENYFWTVAPSTKQELISLGISSTRCVSIHNAIENAVLSKIPQKNAQPTFLFVGRLVRMKGVDAVLEAFEIILRDLPSAVLWIAGEGEVRYLDVLRKKAEKLGFANCVVWWGKVTEKKKLQLMREAHMLLHASIKEGWGLVVLEAASQGTPTVAYPSGGLVDSIVDGRTGIHTKQSTSSQLAFCAVKLYKDKKKYVRLQKNGIVWSKSFTWSRATRQSHDLLRRVYSAS